MNVHGFDRNISLDFKEDSILKCAIFYTEYCLYKVAQHLFYRIMRILWLLHIHNEKNFFMNNSLFLTCQRNRIYCRRTENVNVQRIR